MSTVSTQYDDSSYYEFWNTAGSFTAKYMEEMGKLVNGETTTDGKIVEQNILQGMSNLACESTV